MKMNSTFTNFRKSPIDKNEYVLKVLPNGFIAFICYDAEADKSAAALTVGIGSMANPKEYPGLAHFLEHMLFMGNEKYPKEDEYREFLNRNGGSYNASTGADETQFFFDISNEEFNGALDRFAQFFINPLFLQSSLDKEMKAVDSENKNNLLSDTWRHEQLNRSESNPQSCYNHFSTGNYTTLNKPDIRDQVIGFYNKYYTSEIMELCVVSNQPLEEMTKLVEELFSQVPKRDNYVKPKYDAVLPYDSSNLGYLYKIIPINDYDSLILSWYFPEIEKEYKKKPLDFSKSILDHQNLNSLSLSLINDNLITGGVSSGVTHQSKLFSKVEVVATLTKKGLEQYDEVIKRIFKFLTIVQKEKINKRYFTEIQNILQMTFDTQNKSQPSEIATRFAGTIHKYAPEDLFTGAWLLEEYDEQMIKKYLKSFTLTNCTICLTSQKFKDECTDEEIWYGTKFTKSKFAFTEADIEAYECKDSFGYPPENVFIPKSLDLLPRPAEIHEYPILILEDEQTALWHKQDTTFLVPNATITGTIYLDYEINNRSYLWNDIISGWINSLITDELRTLLAHASEAFLGFSISYSSNYFSVSMNGFNQSMKAAMKIILETFMKIDLSDKEEKLKALLELHIQVCNNFFVQESYIIPSAYLTLFLSPDVFTVADKLKLLTEDKEINLKSLLIYAQNALRKARFEWLMQGNISKEEAIEIAQLCKSILNPEPLSLDRISTRRGMLIAPNHHYIHQMNHPNQEELNSSLVSYFQFGRQSVEKSHLSFLIVRSMENKFFTEFRTNQQLGYIVGVDITNTNGVQGIIFLVQSNVKCPEYVSDQITIFTQGFLKELEEMPDDEYKEYLNAELLLEKAKYQNMYEEASGNLIEISRHRYTFDKKVTACKIIPTLKKEDMIALYKEHFIDAIKRLDIEYVVKGHLEENEAKYVELNEKVKNLKRIKVKSMKEFQKLNCVSPSYYTINMK